MGNVGNTMGQYGNSTSPGWSDSGKKKKNEDAADGDDESRGQVHGNATGPGKKIRDKSETLLQKYLEGEQQQHEGEDTWDDNAMPPGGDFHTNVASPTNSGNTEAQRRPPLQTFKSASLKDLIKSSSKNINQMFSSGRQLGVESVGDDFHADLPAYPQQNSYFGDGNKKNQITAPPRQSSSAPSAPSALTSSSVPVRTNSKYSHISSRKLVHDGDDFVGNKDYGSITTPHVSETGAASKTSTKSSDISLQSESIGHTVNDDSEENTQEGAKGTHFGGPNQSSKSNDQNQSGERKEPKEEMDPTPKEKETTHSPEIAEKAEDTTAPTADSADGSNVADDNVAGEARRIINNYLFPIGIQYGMEWRLNEAGVWAFNWSGEEMGNIKFTLEVPENSNNFFLYVYLPDLDEMNTSTDKLKDMLELNFLSLKTRGGCLSYDQYTDQAGKRQACFHYNGYVPDLAHYSQFEAILTNFIDHTIKIHAFILGGTSHKKKQPFFTLRKKNTNGDASSLPKKLEPLFNMTFKRDNDSRSKVRGFLDELSKTLGKTLELNESGICAFTYDDFTIVIEVPSPENNPNRSYFIYAAFLPIPDDESALRTVLLKALQLNFLSQITRGAVISFDSFNDNLMLHYLDCLDKINTALFRNILENFIHTVLSLHSEFGGDKLYKEIENKTASDPNTAAVPDITSLQAGTTQLFSLLNFEWWKVKKGNEFIKWDEVKRCLKESPEDSKKEYGFPTSYGEESLYPIHKALGLLAPLDVVEAFHEAWPECFEQKNRLGALPISYVAEQRSSIKVLRFVIDKYPDGVKIPTTSGYTALHIAAMNLAPVEVMEMLLAAYPDACKALDNDSKLPLHHMLETWKEEIDPEKVSFLLHHYPQGCSHADKNSLYPLHHAAWSQTEPQIVQAVLDCAPNVISIPDQIGQTPLHVAARSKNVSLAVVKLLVEAKRSTLLAETEAGGNPLRLASNENNPRGELVFFLAEFYSKEEVEKHNFDERFDLVVSYLDASKEDIEYISKSSVFRRILNRKMMQPVIPALLLMDLYALVLIIISYRYLIKEAIISSSSVSSDQTSFFLSNQWHAAFLITGLSWWTLVEVMQYRGSRKINQQNDYTFNPWNWIDIASIILLLLFLVSTGIQNGSSDFFRWFDFFFSICLYLKCVSYLKALQMGFAVFVGGLANVLRNLASFTVVLFIFLWIYSHVLHVAYLDSIECQSGIAPHAYCSGVDSFFNIYTFLLGDFDPLDFKSTYTKLLFFVFTFFSIVVFLNVLIGIVTKSYDQVAQSQAETSFWVSRAKYIAEIDALFNIIRVNRLQKASERYDKFEKSLEKVWEWWFVGVYGTPVELDGTLDNYADWIRFRGIWPIAGNGWKPRYRLLRLYFLRFIGLIIIPIWIITGLVFFGLTWPRQFKEFILIPFGSVSNKKGTGSLLHKKKEDKVSDDVIALGSRVNELESKLEDVQSKLDEVLKILTKQNTED